MEPFVLRGCINEWPAMKWTLDTLSDIVCSSSSDEPLKVRFGAKKHVKGKVLFENESRRAPISKVSDLVEWFQGTKTLVSDDGSEVKNDSHWAYFDYKYVFEVLKPERIPDIDWKVFGLDVNPVDSTIWIGTPGAYTPCHFDSYGFNLHAQLRGAKRWILMEPHEEMKPTRIPYEESTVFSGVDVVGGDAYMAGMTPRMVTLNAGDVLFIPPGWWHSVQCVTPQGCTVTSPDAITVSVNTWVPVPIFDKISRAREAAASAIISLLSESRLVTDGDLCPSESTMCLQDSMDVLKTVVDDLKKECENDTEEMDEADKEDSTSEPSCKRAKCEEGECECEEAVKLAAEDAGQMHAFLRRYEKAGVVVPEVSYEDILEELNKGPLDLVDGSGDKEDKEDKGISSGSDKGTSSGSDKGDKRMSSGSDKIDKGISSGSDKKDKEISSGSDKGDKGISSGSNEGDKEIISGSDKGISSGSDKADKEISSGSDKAMDWIKQRRFIDALTSPDVVQAIVDHMLNWER